MKMNLVPKKVAVYRHNTPSSAEADCHLNEEEARRVVANGDARRINHGKAIRLRHGLKTIQAGSAECLPDSKLPARIGVEARA